MIWTFSSTVDQYSDRKQSTELLQREPTPTHAYSPTLALMLFNGTLPINHTLLLIHGYCHILNKIFCNRFNCDNSTSDCITLYILDNFFDKFSDECFPDVGDRNVAERVN